MATDKRIVGQDVSRVQLSWPIGLPVCRALSTGLWEVRSSLAIRREARLLFCFHKGQMIALHAFIKKTRATSAEELAVALKRLKEVSSWV